MTKLTLIGGRLAVVNLTDLDASVYVDASSIEQLYDLMEEHDIDQIDPKLLAPEVYVRIKDFELIELLQKFRCMWYHVRIQKLMNTKQAHA